MGALAKFWTDASVDNHSKYLIFLAIPINLLLWGCESWALQTSLLIKLEVFLHRNIRRILGISMTEVKDQRITNETVRRNCFGILNSEEKIATRQLTFIGKVTRNSDDHLPTKLITAWCNHKRRRGGILHTNKKSIFHNLRLTIPGVRKTGAPKTWAHFAIDNRYRQHLISGLGTSLKPTPLAPPPPPSEERTH